MSVTRMTRDENGYTITQARIMKVLSDGAWHSQRELLHAIDEEATVETLSVHLHYLRKILTARHEHIHTSRLPKEGTLYMHAKSLAPMSNG